MHLASSGEAPDSDYLKKLPLSSAKLSTLKNQTVVIKYGGNAMKKPELQQQVGQAVVALWQAGVRPVVVHGGGPAIAELLQAAGVNSEFIGGHRKTTPEAMRYVEMALRGRVNGELVSLLNGYGASAVGISGKDAKLLLAKKRFHHEDGKEIDLGQVGDVTEVNPEVIEKLLAAGYLPVVAPVGTGKLDGEDYNINADMAAGHIAGALKAAAYLVLTDVDGLRKDKDDPASLIPAITDEELPALKGSVIQGGMIPKIEACEIALQGGVSQVHIVNGTKPTTLLEVLLTDIPVGTTLTKGTTASV